MISPLLRVLSVRALDNYRLKVALSNGKEGVFDMSPYLDRGVFRELKNTEYFSQVSMVDGGSGIEWPNEQDLSAYTLDSRLQEVRTKSVQEMLTEASEHCRARDGSVYWGKAFNYVTKVYSAFFAEKYGDCKSEFKTEHRDESQPTESQVRRVRTNL